METSRIVPSLRVLVAMLAGIFLTTAGLAAPLNETVASEPLVLRIPKGYDEAKGLDRLLHLKAAEQYLNNNGGAVLKRLATDKEVLVFIQPPVGFDTEKWAAINAKLAAQAPGVTLVAAATLPSLIPDVSSARSLDTDRDVVREVRGFRGKRGKVGTKVPAAPKGVTIPSVIVKYLDETTKVSTLKSAAVQRMAVAHGTHLYSVSHDDAQVGRSEVVVVQPGEDLQSVLDYYNQLPDVDFAEPNPMHSELPADFSPNDPQYVNQWQLPKMALPAAWDIQANAVNIIVADMNSGCMVTHQDIASCYIGYGKSFFADANGASVYTSDVTDVNSQGHGTYCASIIAAKGGDGVGMCGVPINVKFLPLRIGVGGNPTGLHPTAQTVSDALDYAVAQGSKVVNLSSSMLDPDGSHSTIIYGTQTFQDALLRAKSSNVVFTCSAGNEGINIESTLGKYPGGFLFSNMLVVGNSNPDDNPTYDDPNYDPLHHGDAYPLNDTKVNATNWGPVMVDVFAPGRNIQGAYLSSNSAYSYHTGTSTSAPMVAGIVALARAKFPSETAAEICDRIRWSSDRVVSTVTPPAGVPKLDGASLSHGRVNAANALGNRPFITNGSFRSMCNGGSAGTIMSFIITGTASKWMAFRVQGPNLANYGLSPVLADPMMQLYSNGVAIVTQDNWTELSSADKTTLANAGLTPASTLECAWVGHLAPGAYSVSVGGKNGGTGIDIVEMFDLDGVGAGIYGNSRISNFSGRGYSSGTLDSQRAVLGMSLVGPTRAMAFRSLAPTLQSYGVTGWASTTAFNLYNGSGGVLAQIPANQLYGPDLVTLWFTGNTTPYSGFWNTNRLTSRGYSAPAIGDAGALYPSNSGTETMLASGNASGVITLEAFEY